MNLGRTQCSPYHGPSPDSGPGLCCSVPLPYVRNCGHIWNSSSDLPRYPCLLAGLGYETRLPRQPQTQPPTLEHNGKSQSPLGAVSYFCVPAAKNIFK